MSKSKRKLAIIKDKGNPNYNRTIRRVINSIIRDIKNLSDVESYELKNPKSIINSYDICDYKFMLEYYDKNSKLRDNLDKYYRK
jgi:hypothetical protein